MSADLTLNDVQKPLASSGCSSSQGWRKADQSSDWLLALLSPERAGPRDVSVLVFDICTVLLQTLLSGNPSWDSDTKVTSHFLLSCSKKFPWEHGDHITSQRL